MVRLMRWMMGLLVTTCSAMVTQNTSLQTVPKKLENKDNVGKKPEEGLYDLPPENDTTLSTSTIRHLLEIPYGGNCTPPSINDFPPDFMTQTQRAKGGFLIHALLGLYACYGLAAVCDTYFVPSLQLISNKLGMSSDVAGATFMAAGTSSPEFFESIIGSFITEGDIGVGTIVGSAVFNILAVTSVCGILTGMVVPLNWWPLTRDCVFYTITVIALVVMIQDERIYWYESTVLLVMFVMYVLLMYFNRHLATYFESRSWCRKSKHLEVEDIKDPEKIEETVSVLSKANDTTEVHDDALVCQTAMAIVDDALAAIKSPKRQRSSSRVNNDEEENEDVVVHNSLLSENGKVHKSETEESKDHADDEYDEEDEWGPTNVPEDGYFRQMCWIITWPINLLFYFTIPNCNKKRWRNCYPLTFIMSILYIGSLSYFVAWMVTVIGYTIGVPDTVMGITFLAIGTSVPEGYSSVIVCRQGYGNMAISNSVGSNIFDILFCLGLPWLIKALAFTEGGYVQINSSGLVYSTISLLTAVVLLYLVIVLFKFKLNLRVGLTCLLLYLGFLTIASLVEMNMFGMVNPPPCA